MLWLDRLREWKGQDVTVRIERPTNLPRARTLGYRPKQGVILVRQRIIRANVQRPKIRSGRRPKRFTRRKSLKQSHQWTAEIRAQKKYPNCEVLNSYLAGEDSDYRWYEVILLDRLHPAILADPYYSGVVSRKGRTTRGLTSSARKSRGLLNKGKGAEKLRPSVYANRSRRLRRAKKQV